MKKLHQLSKLPIGSNAVVFSINADDSNRRRMLGLGLAPGTHVSALHKSPSGDPTAYCIMGAVIALREEDSSKIIIEI